jgi:alpha-tubulin suppressor-like RCC1 family protein
VAIDDVGILYYSGSAAFMTAMTDSDNGVSTAITPAFVPDAFWAKRAVKVIKFWLSYASNNLIALAGDGTIWVRGASGTSGIYGNGTVVANKVWNQVAIPAKKYTKIYIAADATPCCGALGADGTMYVWGANATQRILAGATTVISTPTLVPGFVGNPITDFAMDANSTMLIAGGVRHAIGINTTAGKFGDGTGNANTVYEALPSNGFVYSKVFSGDADGSEFYYYLTTDKRAVMTGRNNQQFNSGASGANITTPTLMGTGAYQGSVIDIRAHAGSALIHTDQGTVWTSVGATGAANGENGWGTNAVLASGQNLFKRVPVPGLVVGVQSSSNSVASTFGAQYTVLTDRGILYSWGAAAFQIGNQIRFAPAEIPTQGFRQLTPKTNSQLDLAP